MKRERILVVYQLQRVLNSAGERSQTRGATRSRKNSREQVGENSRYPHPVHFHTENSMQRITMNQIQIVVPTLLDIALELRSVEVVGRLDSRHFFEK